MSEKAEDKNSNKILWHSIASGAFLIGLAILFYIGFWPWILALVGLTVIIEGLGKYYSERKK